MYFESLAGCLGYIPMAVVATVVVAVIIISFHGLQIPKVLSLFHRTVSEVQRHLCLRQGYGVIGSRGKTRI